MSLPMSDEWKRISEDVCENRTTHEQISLTEKQAELDQLWVENDDDVTQGPEYIDLDYFLSCMYRLPIEV